MTEKTGSWFQELLIPTEPKPMQIELDGFHNRTLDLWCEVRHHCQVTFLPERGNKILTRILPAIDAVTRSSWRATARKHAAKHGTAGVLRADGSFIQFYREGDKVRQKTWKSVSISYRRPD